MFTKFPACIAGPQENFELPGDRVGWEPERRVQALGKPPQFSLVKWLPGFGPFGPYLVTEVDTDAAITCLLDDEVVQKGSLADMIFDVPDMVARRCARSGREDLIFTGTPAGVGTRRTPPGSRIAEEVLTSRIDGLGELRNGFRAARKP